VLDGVAGRDGFACFSARAGARGFDSGHGALSVWKVAWPRFEMAADRRVSTGNEEN
jgi:hypothetical protein